MFTHVQNNGHEACSLYKTLKVKSTTLHSPMWKIYTLKTLQVGKYKIKLKAICEIRKTAHPWFDLNILCLASMFDKFTGNPVDMYKNVLVYAGLCPGNSNLQQHKRSNYSCTRKSSGGICSTAHWSEKHHCDRGQLHSSSRRHELHF